MSRALTRPFAVLGTLAATLTLAACSGAETSANEEPVDDGSTMFTAVRDACELPATVVQDGGTTLVLDGRGEDDSSASDALEIEEQACALGAINTPDHIVTLMDQTRALDGRQTQQHDGYTYSWTYHPDTGLDIVITDAWQD